MKRGEVWTRSRFGRNLSLVVVGHNSLTAARASVLAVPISDVMPSTLLEPTVVNDEGATLGVALIPRVGEVSKSAFVACAGALSPASLDAVDVALRAALDL